MLQVVAVRCGHHPFEGLRSAGSKLRPRLAYRSRCMNRPKRLVGLLAPVRPEPVMTLPRTVAEVLSDHVLFEVECIDRMYLNVYQPRLQYGGGVSAFFVGHRGHKYASSVLMQPITDAFVANIHH